MTRAKRSATAALTAGAFALASIVAAGTASAQDTVRGVTNTEIKVSGLGYAAFYGPAGQAAKARFDQANTSGEVPGGRKINYIGFADDQSSADINTQKGRALVDQDGIFAAVPVITPFLQAAGYFEQQKVPVLGLGISAAFCDASITYAFGFTGCQVPNPPKYVGNTWGELISEQLKGQGKGGAAGKTAAVIADNNDTGKADVQRVVATAEAVGMKVGFQQATMPPPPATVTDYTPYVQQLMASNGGQPPDVMFLVISRDNVIGLGRALIQAGFKGIQTNEVTYAPQLAGAVPGQSVFTQFATAESPAANMQMIVTTLRNAGIDPIGQPALVGYLAADMFVQILAKVGKKLTSERFQKAASKFTYQIQDVVGPTVYPQADQAATPCGQLATSDGTKWTVTAPFRCSQLLTQTKTGSYKQVPYPQGVKVR